MILYIVGMKNKCKVMLWFYFRWRFRYRRSWGTKWRTWFRWPWWNRR